MFSHLHLQQPAEVSEGQQVVLLGGGLCVGGLLLDGDARDEAQDRVLSVHLEKRGDNNNIENPLKNIS